MKTVYMQDQVRTPTPIVPFRKVSKPSTSSAFHRKLKVPVAEGTYLIPFEKLIRIKADSNYSIVYWTGGPPIIMSKSLKYVEDKLPTDEFFRVHSSHIIALHQIHFIAKDQLTLNEGSQIPISRRKKSILSQMLSDV